jgi:hypothetical protein
MVSPASSPEFVRAGSSVKLTFGQAGGIGKAFLRKYAVTLTLLATEGLLVCLAGLFYGAMRPSLLRGMRLEALPATARLALSAWLVPAAVATGVVFVLAGTLSGLRTSVRHFLLGAGLVVTAFILGFALWAAYAPAFAAAETPLG